MRTRTRDITLLSACGTALYGLAMEGLAQCGCSRRPNGSARYGSSSRPCPSPGETALHTNEAAYSDAMSEHAALGRRELRGAARALMAANSGRGRTSTSTCRSVWSGWTWSSMPAGIGQGE